MPGSSISLSPLFIFLLAAGGLGWWVNMGVHQSAPDAWFERGWVDRGDAGMGYICISIHMCANGRKYSFLTNLGSGSEWKYFSTVLWPQRSGIAEETASSSREVETLLRSKWSRLASLPHNNTADLLQNPQPQSPHQSRLQTCWWKHKLSEILCPLMRYTWHYCTRILFMPTNSFTSQTLGMIMSM